VIAVSSATRRDLENMVEIEPGRVRVIYNAPDPSFFHAGRFGDARDEPKVAAAREIAQVILANAGQTGDFIFSEELLAGSDRQHFPPSFTFDATQS